MSSEHIQGQLLYDPENIYVTEEEKIRNEKGKWNHLKVIIAELSILKKPTILATYIRNYHLMYNTFVPFRHHNKLYALYSNDYTATRIMTLPDCKDLCGEISSPGGFCPVDYFVPYEPDMGILGDFGFVAGCYWGDDSSWKIQFLDLRHIKDGSFIRDDRFGHIELPQDLPLKDAIDMEDYCVDFGDPPLTERLINIAVTKRFIQDDNLELR